MRVCIATSPAQLFHLLRRQAKQPKKPLVLFTHKSLLRAEDASSMVSELAEGSFRVVLDDPAVPAEQKVKRLVLCSGKVYWDLERARQKKQAAGASDADDVAIVRLEQLYPFPEQALLDVLARRQPEQIVWVQEEPRNNGAWDFLLPRFMRLGLDVRYVG